MIALNELSKLYPSGKGIRNLSFTVKKGETFGFLGPNGAGKTTTIRNLLGFLKPDSGSCRIDGLDCWSRSEEIKKNMGYIPGEIAFFDAMTGTSFLRFMQELYGLSDETRQKELIQRFELDPSGKIRKMSKGMKQKLGIVAGNMHNPEILIFDEPTSGLDPLMQDRFVQFIQEERQAGKTILMSSHSFEEIERTCDRAGIIREGFLVDVQDIETLKESQQRRFRVQLGSREDVQKLQKSGLVIHSISGNNVEILIRGSVNSVIKQLATVTVESIDTKAATLEEVFMQYYGKEA